MNWVAKLLLSFGLIAFISLVCACCWRRPHRAQEDDREPIVKTAWTAAVVVFGVSGLVTIASLLLLIWLGGCTPEGTALMEHLK